MPDSPPNPSEPNGARPARRHRVIASAGVVILLAVCALVASAVIPGSHSSAPQVGRAVAAVAGPGHPGRAKVLQTKVFDSRVSARKYGSQVAARENGVNARGQYISDLTPVRGDRFSAPIAGYKRYAEGWAGKLGAAVRALTAQLRAGHRATAERDWTTAFSDYLHLGAVYGFLPGSLNDRLAEVPASTSDTDFPGLHRIERGLWTGESPRSLVPVATAISRAVVTLRHDIPGLRVTAFDYILRSHEIMEDAQRDLMSGAEVPWSGEGVAGTAAALVADEKIVATISPILAGRENTLGQAQYWLARMRQAFAKVRRPDGTYPTLGRLTEPQRILLDGTLAGLCTALSAVPDTLELHPIPTIPKIPGSPRR